MPRHSESERLEKRDKVQSDLYADICRLYENNWVMSEHEKIHKRTSISILKRFITKEFKYSDPRSVNGQIRLMEVEGRIVIDGRIVMVKEPS